MSETPPSTQPGPDSPPRGGMHLFRRRFPIWTSLFIKMTAATATLLLATVGAAFFYSLKVEYELDMHETERFTRRLADIVLQSFDTMAEGNTPYHTKYLASKLLGLPQLLNLRVVAIDGTIQFARDPQEIGKQLDLAHRQPCSSCHTELGIVDSSRVYRSPNDVMTFHLPVNIPNQKSCLRCHKAEYKTLGTLVVEVEVEPMLRKMSTFKLYTLGSLAVALLLSITGTILLFRRFIQNPLDNLRKEMQRVEGGDFNVSPVPASRDEFQELYESFRSMTQQLEQTQTSLNEMLAVQSAKVDDLNRELRRIYSNLVTMEHLSAIGTLSAQVVHEVRTPLNVLSLNLQLLNRELSRRKELPPEATGLAANIGREVERISAILDKFMSRARYTPSAPTQESLRDLILGITGLMEIEARKNKVVFQLAVPPEARALLLQADELRQILINLISNAIYAMPNGGKLEISVKLFEQTYEIVVADTGIGIPSENLSKIFTPFFTTRENGTGLGLAIVRRLVEEMGGDIQVKSKASVGTSFHVVLPKKTPEEA